MKQTRYAVTIAFVIILVIINMNYYFTTAETLQTNQEEKIELIVSNVRSSISSTYNTEKYFNSLLAEDLRETSMNLQSKLPPDIADVTNEQLEELKKEFGLEGITLFARQGDDIIGTKSSNPKEIGLTTKDWADGNWFRMFDQLLENHNVTPISGFGEPLENFWSGPIDTSKADPTIVTKWGYYNDGTTNYIINPFVKRSMVNHFYEEAGAERIIENIIDSNEYILNVTVANGKALRDVNKPHKMRDEVRPSDRILLAGERLYPVEDDIHCALSSLENKELIHYETEYKGKKIMKSYFPTVFVTANNTTDEVVIAVTSDYETINSKLKSRATYTLLNSLLCFVFGLVVLYIAVQIINRKERTIHNVQDMYKQHIDSLFESMREQKHDLNHHLYTLAGLSSMNLYSELDAYVKNLVNLHHDAADIVDVNLPALSGLIQSKKAEAKEKDIEFEYYMENMDKLDMELDKTTDLVKAIGNILDNAFHAVEESLVSPKRISIYGKFQNSLFTISISNNGDCIPMEVMDKIFDMGMTTRKDIGGTGVGLASSKKAVERYKGSIQLTSSESATVFTITMPITKKEVRINKDLLS